MGIAKSSMEQFFEWQKMFGAKNMKILAEKFNFWSTNKGSCNSKNERKIINTSVQHKSLDTTNILKKLYVS